MQSVFRSKILSSPLPYSNYFSRKSIPGIVRFQKSAAGGTNRPESNGDGDGVRMDKAAGKKEKRIRGDTMSSLGEGYATRSEEEGFGGIYRGNQDEYENEDEKEKDVREHSHEFDKQQGSEVKEKEKSRHQKDANA